MMSSNTVTKPADNAARCITDPEVAKRPSPLINMQMTYLICKWPTQYANDLLNMQIK